MKAIVQNRYGSPDDLELKDVDKPVAKDDEVLVHVRAAAVNPPDWAGVHGVPYIVRLAFGLRTPKLGVRGTDVAGTIEAVGKNVTRLQVGDEVFGRGSGTFAEYAVAAQEHLVPKPADITFEQAAAVPMAGMTALQGLRDAGRIEAGQKVLINGASGGIGTFAVQIAKSYGAEVTGVCSTRNVDLVRSIGAEHVIDYTQEDFTRGERRYDLLLDTVGNRSLSELRRVLVPKGPLVIVGGGGGRLLGPFPQILGAVLLSPFVSQRMAPVTMVPNKDDLEFLKELIEAGKVTPVIDRTYQLSEVPEAIRYLERGHARGKVVITV